MEINKKYLYFLIIFLTILHFLIGMTLDKYDKENKQLHLEVEILKNICVQKVFKS